MKRARRSSLLLLGVMAASGCTGPQPQRATFPDPPHCGREVKLEPNVSIEIDDTHPTVQRFDDGSRCVVDRDGKSPYAVFRLPPYRAPWVLTIQSLIDGKDLFAPEVRTLDQNGKVRRVWGFDRFSRRGDQLEASLFFNETDGDDRYVLIRSTQSVVGKGETQMVSNSFFIPFLNTVMPIVYLQGVEREREIVLSNSGLVHLQARAGSPMRRQFDADGVARSEIGNLVR